MCDIDVVAIDECDCKLWVILAFRVSHRDLWSIAWVPFQSVRYTKGSTEGKTDQARKETFKSPIQTERNALALPLPLDLLPLLSPSFLTSLFSSYPLFPSFL